MTESSQRPEILQTVSYVIFGASGDLSHRKLIPSLFSLFLKNRLGNSFEIVGFAIETWTEAQFIQSLRQGMDSFAYFKFTDEQWQQFAAHLHYMSGNFTSPPDYQKLKELLDKLEAPFVGRIFYLAVPPAFIGPITQNLSKADMLNEKESWRRVVVEKPFGSSYETAHKLNEQLHQVMQEQQIYRIDHYLGKETVQNLLVFRFANIMFEPVWCNQYIDHVQISVLEEVGVGHRGGYYDQAGVLRDMFQNHILQLLAYTAIERPDSMLHEDLHARKLEVLRAIRPITDEDVAQNTVRAQYDGYCDVEGVAENSQTPTYAALRLFIDNERWEGVPFYLRSGKALKNKCTEIIIRFRCPPAVYPMPTDDELTPNLLAICIQPDEGIYLRFEAKVPDTEAAMRSVEMEFHYANSFGPSSIPEAYERLLLEVVQGDHTLFVPDDTTELAWKLIDPILKEWEGPHAPPLETYPQGTYGPENAKRLIGQDNRQWMMTCGGHDGDDQ